MQKTDRFLIGIVSGIAILVLIALTVALRRPEETYRTDDTPAAVVHNYLLALRREDMVRAHACLSSSLPGYPQTLEAFIGDINNNWWYFGQDQATVGFIIGATREPVPDRAAVTVEARQFSRSGLLDSYEWSEEFEMYLVRADGQWRLTGSRGNRYWVHCWELPEGCSNR